MHFVVMLNGVTVGRQRNALGFDSQRAIDIIDRIRQCYRVTVTVDNDRICRNIIRGTGIYLRTRNFNGLDIIPLCQLRTRPGIRCQCFSIIDLLGAACGNGDLSLPNLQRAAYVGNEILRCDILDILAVNMDNTRITRD